jgi:transposase InsO family protein
MVRHRPEDDGARGAQGLKVPRRPPERGRLWLADGSCMRLRAQRPNHVWSYDFVPDRTHDGRRIRMLTAIDERTRKRLAHPVARRLNSNDVLAVLADLFAERGPPEHVRSDNGSEFPATAVRDWLGRLSACRSARPRQSPSGRRSLAASCAEARPA